MTMGSGKSITNKELIERLTKYFMEQEQIDIAYALASVTIDLHRILNQDELPESERRSLAIRMQLNEASLKDFIANGPKHKLKVRKFSLDA
jgi:Tfp pilus assembly ATPase PilU